MDYTITELLTRTIALDRLKHLSDQVAEAKEKGDWGLVHALTRERLELRDEYFKAVK